MTITAIIRCLLYNRTSSLEPLPVSLKKEKYPQTMSLRRITDTQIGSLDSDEQLTALETK